MWLFPKLYTFAIVPVVIGLLAIFFQISWPNIGKLKCDIRRKDKYTVKRFNPLCTKLNLLFNESLQDHNISNYKNHDYALYPKRYYESVAAMLANGTKSFSYCFIGGLKTDERTFQRRRWILPYIDEYFDDDSYLQFTDSLSKSDAYYAKKKYDHTILKDGFVPKYVPNKDRGYFDNYYFEIMSKCQFCLAPAGDRMFSQRFYEALMCKCIPIVSTAMETFRSKAESTLPYYYYMTCDEEMVYKTAWAEKNYDLFLSHHTLKYNGPTIEESNT